MVQMMSDADARMLEQLGEEEWVARALAQVDLLARAAREPSSAESAEAEHLVNRGLRLMADDLTEGLAARLRPPPRR